MQYTLLLWPHANARYQAETRKLALSELELMLVHMIAILRTGTHALPCEKKCGIKITGKQIFRHKTVSFRIRSFIEVDFSTDNNYTIICKE